MSSKAREARRSTARRRRNWGSKPRHSGARAQRANLESRARALGVWIPGLRQEAHPGMTMVSSCVLRALCLEVGQRAAGENAILGDQLIRLDIIRRTEP